MDRVPSFDLKFARELEAKNLFTFTFLLATRFAILASDFCREFSSSFLHFTFNKNTKIIFKQKTKDVR